MFEHVSRRGRVKGRKHFWESQFTQQALRKHFSCHDSTTTLGWWGEWEGPGGKMEERDTGGENRRESWKEPAASSNWTGSTEMNGDSFRNKSTRFIFEEMMESKRLPATCRFVQQCFIHRAPLSLATQRWQNFYICKKGYWMLFKYLTRDASSDPNVASKGCSLAALAVGPVVHWLMMVLKYTAVK